MGARRIGTGHAVTASPPERTLSVAVDRAGHWHTRNLPPHHCPGWHKVGERVVWCDARLTRPIPARPL